VVKALAIDIGTSSVRTALVDESGVVTHIHQERLTVSTPRPGEVELDAREIGRLVIELAGRTLGEGRTCDAVGVTNQRATTIVFDPATGDPIGPALGWQDLRTVIDCLVLQGQGLRLAPNQSATKAKWLVNQSGRPARELRFATVETWVTWLLTEGASHITDRSNAGVTGLVDLKLESWDERLLALLELDPAMMPSIVDTMGTLGVATALAGSPPITAMVGDQPASLFGQSCVTRGVKITFGTGAMLDMVRDDDGPTSMNLFQSGCFPVVVRSQNHRVTWGIEGIILSAGSCVEWLRDDLGLIDDVEECEALADSVASCDGVSFVPALSGLGTPQWDFGARGGFFGITRGSTKAHLVRAVLDGIAQRGADLVEAAEIESGAAIDEIRVDGGMSVNRYFVQCLADFTGCRVAVSSELEATTRGVGLMALVGAGHLTLEQVEGLWTPVVALQPRLDDEQRESLRTKWRETVRRAERTIPELSAVAF
jgi:glycerol kinase